MQWTTNRSTRSSTKSNTITPKRNIGQDGDDSTGSSKRSKYFPQDTSTEAAKVILVEDSEDESHYTRRPIPKPLHTLIVLARVTNQGSTPTPEVFPSNNPLLLDISDAGKDLMIRKDGDVVESLSLSSATIRGYRLAHEKAGMLSIKPYDSQIEHVFLYENNADSQEFLEVIEMDGDMHLGDEKFDYYIQALTFDPHCSTKEICGLWEGVPRLPFARSKSPARIPLPGSKSSTLKHTATSSSSTSFVQSKTTDLDPEEEDELQLQIAIQESLETGNETLALPEEPKAPVNIMTPPPSSNELTGSPHSSNEVILVYPSTGTNLVSLHQEDLNRLKEGEFLNDSLIEFYIRWTTNTYSANAQNFHIFNTFFYQTLTTKDEGAKKLVIEDTFVKVRRWTRKFNIFEKDFLIIPINERVHWYLAVIWKPGAFLAKESDGQIDVDESEIDKCRIFVFDSLQGKHPTIGKNLFAYLAAEAKDKNRGDIITDHPPVKNVKVQNQMNHCDCGLFLLHYITTIIRSPRIVVEAILRGDALDTVAYGTLREIRAMRMFMKEIIEDLRAKQPT